MTQVELHKLLLNAARICSDNSYPETARELSILANLVETKLAPNVIQEIAVKCSDLVTKKLHMIHACDTKSGNEFRDSLTALNTYMGKL